MTTPQTDAPTLKGLLSNAEGARLNGLTGLANAIDARDAVIADLVGALERIVSASDYYGKEPPTHDELTLAYAHKSTGNIARAAIAKAAALKGSG